MSLRTIQRITLVATLTAVAALAPAKSAYLDAFVSHYKLGDDSKLVGKSCGVCHVSDEDYAFNPYGRDMKKAMADSGVREPDDAVFASLDDVDSDGDGNANGKEIGVGSGPGDPTVGGAPGVTPKAAPVKAEKKAPSFPPKNGFHPAIVHFPIALFIAGLVLDLLGMVRKDKGLLQAGWYTILMAAVTTLGGILSGVLAMSLLKLPYKGLIFNHIVWAAASTAIIWVLVAMRVYRHEKMNVWMRVVYYVLATACFLAISWAGHLGGAFVYGE